MCNSPTKVPLAKNYVEESLVTPVKENRPAISQPQTANETIKKGLSIFQNVEGASSDRKLVQQQVLNELPKLGLELLKINTYSGGGNDEDHDSLSMSVGAIGTENRQNVSLNDQIALCSSMIGYFHFCEAASGAIGFPPTEIEEITRFRLRIEKRLGQYSQGTRHESNSTQALTQEQKVKQTPNNIETPAAVAPQQVNTIAEKRQLKLYLRLHKKFSKVRAKEEYFANRPSLKSFYSDDWVDLVDFRLCDAAKPEERYIDNEDKDITHIYSYNKVMSVKDLMGIADILNRTNYRVLAWYFNPT